MNKITISPLAYQKIITANSFSAWEVGFYGITDDDDVTRVHDVFMPEQKCNAGRNEFDEASISEYVTSYLKKGYSHRQLTTVWIHTHPGSGVPAPSADDKEMFERMTDHGGDIAVMIIATKTDMKGWIRANMVRGLQRVAESTEEVEVDWSMDTPQRFITANWHKRYKRVVSELKTTVVVPVGNATTRQCSRCRVWKPFEDYKSCKNPKCFNSLATVCGSCREAMNGLCQPCWLKTPLSEQKANTHTQVQVWERPAACDYDCCNCTEECGQRRVAHEVDTTIEASDYCDTDCTLCSERYCYDRTDIWPAYNDCLHTYDVDDFGVANCRPCSEFNLCPYAAEPLDEDEQKRFEEDIEEDIEEDATSTKGQDDEEKT
jgi:hypothetical protein